MLDDMPWLIYDRGIGNDTYHVVDQKEPVFGIVSEQPGGYPGAADTLSLDYDVNPDDLEFIRLDGDLLLNDPVHEVYIMLKGEFSDPGKRIEYIKYGDTTMDYEALCCQTNLFVGTEKQDTLTGYPETNYMWGKGDNDMITGNDATNYMLGSDKEADIEKLTECRRILTKHTGFFSEYRDAVKLALLSEMALSETPEQYIEDVKAVYKKLHKGKFRDNSYMVLAAMLTCDLGKQESADEIVEKHNEIMKQMNKLHPILTDSEDISYVLLLALSDRPVDSIISDMNECFDYLKKTCKIKAGPDSVQRLSEILALTEVDIREKCDKVISIYDILKNNKADITGGCAFSALGTLVGVDEAPEVIAREIMEADVFLDGCKGFDEKSVNKNQRLMFAVMLAAEACGYGSVSRWKKRIYT